jgi:hypothetical protein
MKRPVLTAAIVGVLSSACSTHTLLYADPSRFTVTSTPAGATVYVMGQALGVTPQEILREQVFPGNYPSQLQAEYGIVTLEYQGCETYRRSVNNTILEDGLAAKLNCKSTEAPAAIPMAPTLTTKQRLIELKSLYDEGLITEQEYKERRKAVLNDI